MCILSYDHYAECGHRERIFFDPSPDNPKCKGFGNLCVAAELEDEDVDNLCYECWTPTERKAEDWAVAAKKAAGNREVDQDRGEKGVKDKEGFEHSWS